MAAAPPRPAFGEGDAMITIPRPSHRRRLTPGAIMTAKDRTSRRWPSSRAVVLALVLPFCASACNDILDVHLPGGVQEEALDDPALAATLAVSVISVFKCSWNNS